MTLSYQGYGSRVHDTGTASTMLGMYADGGYRDLDTAHAYGVGSGEQMLGDLGVVERFRIATRYDPEGANHAQEGDKLKAAFPADVWKELSAACFSRVGLSGGYRSATI